MKRKEKFMVILLIEDNETIAKGLKYSLENNNYKVVIKHNYQDAKHYLTNHFSVDLIILDITLPDGNGFDLFKIIIKPLNIPTIFLTAKDEEDDIVKGLTMGAEDYLTKPFSTKELLARITKILNRRSKKSISKINDFIFDWEKMIVLKNNEKISLTALEIKLLQLLLLNVNKVVTRAKILDTIWDITGNDVSDHTITVYFNRIREKLGTDIIKTIKGIGYEIDDEK